MSLSLRLTRGHFAAYAEPVLWRALATARALNGRSPAMAQLLRRCVLLLWWTATFQLHTHARYWLRARRLRRIEPASPLPILVGKIDPLTLNLPIADIPLVSVIVPTYGKVDFTLRCLASIAAHAPSIPIEVIVIDDAWNDPRLLQKIRGIRLIRNETNLGFLRSCNKAAGLARGQYLYFLNNDTQVLANWLEPMLALLRDCPATGAVGAKLLYPNGRLQEAGGIVWRDGTGWNFGRHEDPTKPVYNYVREVDYCSAAALIVQSGIFARLGGFDERFAPAYFEDTDLCFRLRREGLKTLYQPAARVVHFEGVSHGRDTAVGLKSFQVTNRRTFTRMWAAILQSEHYPSGENVFRARDRAIHRKVILVIDHYVPQPDRDAGSRAMMACLETLLQAGFIVKFWPHNLGCSPGYTDALQAMGIEVFYGNDQPPFATWIRKTGGELDLVLVSRPDVAEDVIPQIRQHSRARLIYYGHDLHFRRLRLQAQVTHDDALLRTAEHMAQRERAIWRQADLSLYLSEEEALIVAAMQPDAPVGAVIPYCFDTFGPQRDPPRSQEIIFVGGGGHPPNQDALIWFVQAIFPLIAAAVPAARLSVIGANPGPRVHGMATETIAIRPNVTAAELDAAYCRARVAVVPLRCGAGVKLKVVEALRAGLPLVTTTIGAQGLPGLAQIADVQDDAAAFASAVIALLRDDTRWRLRNRQQIDFAEVRFSRPAMTKSLLDALDLQP